MPAMADLIGDGGELIAAVMTGLFGHTRGRPGSLCIRWKNEREKNLLSIVFSHEEYYFCVCNKFYSHYRLKLWLIENLLLQHYLIDSVEFTKRFGRNVLA
jgi:hypothetical protein